MVGRLFGSQSQEGIVPAPLNTPKSQSRKDRIEQARQEKSRRRNFGFLKTAASERGVVSSNTLSKRREHAKQLANLAYSEDPANANGSSSLTPTSRYANQQLLSSFDADSPQGSAQAPLDPFSTADSRGFSIPQKRNNAARANTTSLFFDSQREMGSDREPTASTVDTFDTSSVGSAFDMEFVAAASTAMARHPSPVVYAGTNATNNGPATRRRNRINNNSSSNNNNTSNVSLDHYFVESSERNTISMPTIPSNSSMQASNLHQRGISATGSFSSTTSNTQQQQRNHQTSHGGSSNSSVGAAARRRMRSHMRNQPSGNSSVGSASSNQYHPQSNLHSDAISVDASFASSAQSTPPESPSSIKYALGGGGSASKNRLGRFQQNQRGNHNNLSNLSFTSTGGGSVASSSVASPNIFDSEKVDGGFTFDAFGLDQVQVEREVNEAMRELAGQGIPGFSIFVDKTASAVGGTAPRKDSFMVQSDDEFTPQAWDTSPISSRNASPVQSILAQDGEDFVDGFRIKQPAAPVAVNSYGQSYGGTINNSHMPTASFPNRSANSSSILTEESKRQLSRNLSRGAANGRNYVTNDKNTNSISNQRTPPRWESSASRVPTASTSPQTTPSAAFRSPVVKNPWKEDPWASDDGGNGSGSDFGGQEEALSDVHDYRGVYGSGGAGSYNSRGGRRSYSDAKSDIGVSSPNSAAASLRPTFHRLPPDESPKQNEDDNLTDHSDDLSQMQEELANEFAEEFVARSVSSKASRESASGSTSRRDDPAKRVLDYGNNDEGNNGVTDEGANSSNFRAETSTSYRSRFNRVSGNQEQSSKDMTTHPFKVSAVRSEPRQWQARIQSAQTEVSSEGPEGDRGQQANSGYKSRDVASPSISAMYHRQDQSKPDATIPRANENGFADSRQKQLESSSQSLIGGFKSHQSLWGSRSEQNRQGSGGATQQLLHQPSDVDTRVEEKKEDDETSLVSPPAKVGSLKARWEAKTRTQQGVTYLSTPPKPTPKLTNYGRVQTLDNSLEMLSPEIVEARRVAKQQSRTEQLRKSLGVDTTPQGISAKSDITGSRYDSSVASNILDRVRKNTSIETTSPCARSDTKSDGGSAPSFLANVKLRNVSSPAALIQSERTAEREAASPTSPAQSVHRNGKETVTQNEAHSSSNRHSYHDIDEIVEQPSGRKLTYRERRELELQRERVEKEKSEISGTDHTKTDVASLIRKRIAANKQMNFAVSKESSSNEFERLPTPLKPAEKENNFQAGSRPNQMTNFVNLSQTCSPLQNDASSGQVGQVVLSRPPQPRQDSPKASIFDSSPTPPIQEVQKIQLSPRNLRVSPRYGTGTSQVSSADQYELERQERGAPDTSSRSNKSHTPHDSPSKSAPLKSPYTKRQENVVGKSEEAYEEDKIGLKHSIKPDVRQKMNIPDDLSSADVKSMLSSFLGNRAQPALPLPTKDDDTEALKKHHIKSPSNSPTARDVNQDPPPPPPPSYNASGSRPALKDDPKFERYFRMLKMGLPVEVAKHAMVRDGLDPSVLDLDHDKPIGVPLKADPKFEKYFKMIKIGIAMNQVKHAMERDGLNPEIMDQDHNLPVITVEKRTEKKVKETHRRARLHWKTIGKIVTNSLWAKVENEVNEIDIDEEEFNELFKADLKETNIKNKGANITKKKGAAVRVIDAKRANNGGIILARLKMTHDEMADAVDRIDSDVLSAEQIENIIEYLPTKEEREALEEYMLEGGQDAAEKFDGLCECEKFMVSMMTVKHAKRKIRALLFKLQFLSCMESIAEDARTIDTACDELSHSNRLRQLFGIILQFGNRLNTAGVSNKGKAGAFTLDSLLKLSQAKAFDKKTTFLHYIIMIVQRNNEILLNYYDDLPTVLKGDKVFWDQCIQDLEEVENQLENVRRISLYEAKMKKNYSLQRATKSDEDSLSEMELTLEEEVESLRATPTGIFTLGAIKQVSALRDKIERTKAKFEMVLEYFGEDTRKLQPHELFNVISAFTRDFQKAKDEVFSSVQKKLREERKKARVATPNEKQGLPPARPHLSANKPSAILRASDHQPKLNNVFSQGNPRPPSTAVPNLRQEVSSTSNDARQSSPRSKVSSFGPNHVAMDSFTNERSLRPSESEVMGNPSMDYAPRYRNMQYTSEIPEEKTSTTSPSNAQFTDEGQRYAAPQQQRYPRQFPPMQNGMDGTAKESSMNIALAPQIRPTIPINSTAATTSTGAGASSSVRSPREALRNRRRLEAMRARHATSANSSIHNNNPAGGGSDGSR